MLILSFILVAGLTPVSSLKLAQGATIAQSNQQTINIQKAKADLRAKISIVEKKKESIATDSSVAKELNKVLDRLNKYLKYLEYLTENPSLATKERLLIVSQATDRILDMLDKIILYKTEVVFFPGDLLVKFYAVTQADMGLEYHPATAPNASGMIGFIPATGETPASGSDDADTNAGSGTGTGTNTGGGGGSGGAPTCATPPC